MPRIFLCHWNELETVQRIEELTEWGITVAAEWESPATAWHRILRAPPDALFISLAHQPEAGHRIANLAQERDDFVGMPLVFITADRDQVLETRAEFPHAYFASPDAIRTFLSELFQS